MANLYDTIDGSILKKPGQYNLTDVVLVSYRSQRGDNQPEKIGIDTLIGELNLY